MADEYRLRFTPTDTRSTDANELTYAVYTGSGGTGTLLASGTATSGVEVLTNIISDSSLSDGANTRYIRVTDGAGNVTQASVTVTVEEVPEGEYVVFFTVSDTYSTTVSWQVRTAAGTGGTLLASGTAAPGELVDAGPIADAALANGSNTRYIRLVDEANNSANPSFVVDAELMVHYDRDFTATTQLVVIPSRLAELNRTHHTTLASSIARRLGHEREGTSAITVQVTASKHVSFVRRALASAQVARTQVADRFRTLTAQTASSLSMAREFALSRYFNTSTSNNVTTNNLSARERLHQATTAALVSISQQQGVQKLYQMATSAAVSMDKLMVLSMPLVAQTRANLERTIQAIGVTILTLTAQTKAAIYYNRFFNISAIYTATTSAVTNYIRHHSRAFTSATQGSVSLQRGVAYLYRIQTRSQAILERLTARYRTFRSATGSVTFFTSGRELLREFVVTTSALVTQTRRTLLQWLATTTTNVQMQRHHQRIHHTAVTVQASVSRLAERTKQYVINTRAAVNVILANEITQLLVVQTRATVHMVRDIALTPFRVVTGAAVALSRFLRQVRDFWSVHIFDSEEYSVYHYAVTDAEYSAVYNRDEWSVVLNTHPPELPIA